MNEGMTHYMQFTSQIRVDVWPYNVADPTWPVKCLFDPYPWVGYTPRALLPLPSISNRLKIIIDFALTPNGGERNSAARSWRGLTKRHRSIPDWERLSASSFGLANVAWSYWRLLVWLEIQHSAVLGMKIGFVENFGFYLGKNGIRSRRHLYGLQNASFDVYWLWKLTEQLRRSR